MSPFSINGSTPTNTPLTVGDVIGHLPPDVVRAGALPAEQPLALPPALLENALRSGQPVLPVFELYRVCPALFQMPISPQDPRVVPLPAAKLPGLIAQAREGQGSSASAAPPASPSPFSMVPSPGAAPAEAAPFQAAQPASAAPARFPMSPFAAAAQPEAPPEAARTMAAEMPVASPFSRSAEAPQQPAESPFSMGAAAAQKQEVETPSWAHAPGGSPFGMPPQAVFPAAQPPAPSADFSGRSPAAVEQPVSITGLFTPRSQEQASTPSAAPAMPFGTPFAAAMKEAAPPAPAQAFASPQMPSSSGGVAKLGFAAVLNGYSLEELGFNPAMVPEWIVTNLPASVLSAQLSSGQVMVELGVLIDGLSDVGFRNTLTSAKRDHQVRLPQNEVFHALTSASTAAPVFGGGAAPAPAAAQRAPVANPFVIQPGSPAGQVNNREDAPAPVSFPSSQPSPSPLFAPAPAENSALQAPGQPFAPKFGASLNPFAKSQSSEAPAPPAPSIFGQSAPEPVAPQQSAPSLFAPAPASPPASPLFQTFGSPPASSPFASQPAMQPTGPLSAAAKPFDPFASTSSLAAKAPADSGFSSAQLLGQAPAAEPAASSPFSAPVPEFKPLMSAFAPKTEEAAPAPPQTPPSAPRGLFSTQAPSVPLFSEPAAQPRPVMEPRPAPVQPAAATAPSQMAAVKHSFLGLAPLDTQTDQLLLRALLGTEEKLSAPRVVELLATQSGLSAWVCLHGAHVLSHADSSKPDAADFQRQAPDIARQLRGLAPLIGIEGAETFTLNAGGRLLTFCFPGTTTVAVLHEHEPSTGLRDKITLIARELARMLG
ncbi:MAG: hypothetical protein Q8M07_12120 [Prosthecobacter sp.]|nr:hypothetical protein [Prosthecobacter sp.]